MPYESSVAFAHGNARHRRLLVLSGRLLTCAVAAGAILRLSVGDRTPLVAPLFYALPLPVLSVLALLRTAISLLLKQRRATAFWVWVTAAIVLWCLASTVRWHEPLQAAKPIRIVCWNVARGGGGWNAEIAQTIRREQPDVVGLIEAGGDPRERQRFCDVHFSDYDAVPMSGGLLCLARGTAGQGRVLPLSTGGRAGQVPVRIDGRELTVVLVDIDSHPHRFRAAPLAALAQLADGMSDRPVVILGDFNTPSDSVLFEPLRAHHAESFDAAGRGYAATWPIPLPVLALDQIWTNGRLRPLRCEHRWTMQSDHRPVVADVAIIPPE